MVVLFYQKTKLRKYMHSKRNKQNHGVSPKKKMLIIYNLFFLILISISLFLMIQFFDHIFWWVFGGTPITLAVVFFLIKSHLSRKNRIIAKLRFSPLGIFFLIMAGIWMCLALLLFSWIIFDVFGAMRLVVAAIVLMFSPVLIFVPYYFTTRLILRIK